MATPTPSKALIVPAVVTTHRLRSASASVRHSRHPPIPICGYGPRCCHLMAKLGLFRICGKIQAKCADSDTFVFLGTLCKGNFHRGSPNPKIKEEALPRVSNQTRAWKKGRPVQNCQGGLKEEELDTKKLNTRIFFTLCSKHRIKPESGVGILNQGYCCCLSW